jgi:hypothetical protein
MEGSRIWLPHLTSNRRFDLLLIPSIPPSKHLLLLSLLVLGHGKFLVKLEQIFEMCLSWFREQEELRLEAERCVKYRGTARVRLKVLPF